MWFNDVETGATGQALSDDGLSFAWVGEISSAGDRFLGLDVALFSAGGAAAWEGTGGIYVTPGGAEAELASEGWDRFALDAGFSNWSPDSPLAPNLVLTGSTWTMWAEGRDGDLGQIGSASGTPTPGTWIGLSLEWDGTTATLRWGEGATLSAPLSTASGFTLGIDGVLEIDEAQLVYEPVGGGDDSGDPTDDSGAGDSGAGDSGAESGVDSVSTAGDSGGPSFNAAQLSGEPGGWGCQAGAGAPAGLLLLASLLARRKEST